MAQFKHFTINQDLYLKYIEVFEKELVKSSTNDFRGFEIHFKNKRYIDISRSSLFVPGYNMFQMAGMTNDEVRKKLGAEPLHFGCFELNETQKEPIVRVLRPDKCYLKVRQLIAKKYPGEEYLEILKTHQGEEPSNEEIAIERHELVRTQNDTVINYPNCVSYDIHKAHASALMEAFPKCKKDIAKLIENTSNGKLIVNTFVGYIARHIKKDGKDVPDEFINPLERGFYNWIRRRTRALIDKAIAEVGGLVIYANTDGFISYLPKGKPSNLGDGYGQFGFKWQGDVRVYINTKKTKWFLIEEPDGEKVGNLFISLRDRVNLKEKKIVRFDVTQVFDKKIPVNVGEVNLNENH